MRVIVEVAPQEKDSIDGLVRQGRYSTLEQFVGISIRNQILLEHDGAPSTFKPQVAPEPSRPASRVQPTTEGLPWTLPQTVPVGLGLAPHPASASPLPQFVTKLLPVKLVVRVALAEQAKQGAKEIDLNGFSNAVSEAATNLRGTLVALQEKSPRTRGDQFHPGLPERETKSLMRFQTYYAAGSGGAASQSIPVRLGFLTVRIDQKTGNGVVGLTDAGVAFARLPNPVLDNPATANEAFTDQEVALMLAAIGGRLPADRQLLGGLLAQVRKGSTSRDTLTSWFPQLLSGVIPNSSEAVQSSFFVATMSRLVEMGGVALEKDGKRTSYILGKRVNVIKEAFA